MNVRFATQLAGLLVVLSLFCGIGFAQQLCSSPNGVTVSPTAISFPNTGGPSSFGVTAVPTCTWTAVSNLSYVHILSQTGIGSGIVQISVDANPDLAVRGDLSFAIKVTPHDGNPAFVGITQAAASGDFFIGCSPGLQNVLQGGSTSFAISITRIGGFAGAVSLSISGLPANATATFSPNNTLGNSSTMTINAGVAVPGSYSLTIRGVNGGAVRTCAVTANILLPSPLVSFVDPTFVTGAAQGVFYVANDQHVRHFFGTPTGWQKDDPTALSGAPLAALGSSLTGFLDPTFVTGTSQSVFYAGPDQHLYHLFAGGATWVKEDLTPAGSFPLVAVASPLASFLDPTSATGFKQSVFYLSGDQHIHRLASSGNGWQHDDLTSLSGAPLAVTGSPLSTFVDASGITGSNTGVFYLGTDQHVHHIFKFPAGWQTDDVTSITNAPAAVSGSSMSAFLDATSATGARQSVFYLGADQHVHHIFAFTSTGTWQQDDISAITGAPAAASGSQLTSFLDRNAVTGAFQSVFYAGTDGNVKHIFGTASGWQRDDISALSHAQAAETASPLSSFLDATFATGASQAVFYVGTDHHVRHIFPMGTWQTDDPTALTGGVPAN